MKIKLTELVNAPGSKIDVCGDIIADNICYHGDEYEFSAPVRFEGKLTNNGKELVLEGKATATFYASCARCLEKSIHELEYDVCEAFVREDEANNSDGEEITYSGDVIEPDEVIMSGFYMNAPLKYLCSEDCKGLCLECGQNLNKGDCDCDKEQIDPRWEALKKIMDNNKNS